MPCEGEERRSAGLCIVCGYDLRMSAGRCRMRHPFFRLRHSRQLMVNMTFRQFRFQRGNAGRGDARQHKSSSPQGS